MRNLAANVVLWSAFLLATATLSASGGEQIHIDSVEFAGHLSGIVMVYGAVALKGIEVSEMGKDSQKVVKTVVTDSNGKFDLGNAERGVHVLRLQGEGYNTYWYKVRIDPKSKATLKLMISTEGKE